MSRHTWRLGAATRLNPEVGAGPFGQDTVAANSPERLNDRFRGAITRQRTAAMSAKVASPRKVKFSRRGRDRESAARRVRSPGRCATAVPAVLTTGTPELRVQANSNFVLDALSVLRLQRVNELLQSRAIFAPAFNCGLVNRLADLGDTSCFDRPT